MTAVAGKVRCKIKVTSGSKIVESAPIIMVVDAAAVPDGSDMSKTDINDAVANATQKIVDQVKDNIPSDYAQLSTDVSSLKEDLVNIPLGNLDIVQNLIANATLSKSYKGGSYVFVKGEKITLQSGKYICVVYDTNFSAKGYFSLNKDVETGYQIVRSNVNKAISFSLNDETTIVPVLQISLENSEENGDYHVRYSIYSNNTSIIPEDFIKITSNDFRYFLNGILSPSGAIEKFLDNRTTYVVSPKIRCTQGQSIKMESECLNNQYTSGIIFYSKTGDVIQNVRNIGSRLYEGVVPKNAAYFISCFNTNSNSLLLVNDNNMFSTIATADTAQATADTAQATADTAVKKKLSKNLFDKNDEGVLDDYFINYAGQAEHNQYTSAYFITDYIRVQSEKPYSLSPSMSNNVFAAFYDIKKKFIKTFSYTDNKNSINMLSPSNAEYIRFTGLISKKDVTMLEQNSEITSYEEYSDYLPLTTLAKKVDVLSETVGIAIPQETQISTSASMVDGESIQLDVPDIKQNNRIAFYGKLGNFSSVTISHGRTAVYASGYIVIDEENMSAYSYTTQEVLNGTYQHGLTFKDFVSVEIKVNDNLSADVTITTGNGGIFTKNIKWNGNRDTVKATVTGGTLADCALTFRCSDYGKDVWAFGDSYFDMWPLKVSALGAKNWLVDGYSGRGSNGAYASLEKCLMHGKPKYILWCMGMNDPDTQTAINSNWKVCVEKLIALCESQNIIPIFCTVPTCTGGQVADTDISNFRNHAFKNAYVRDSGYRYVDIAKAVGSNDSDGTWYEGMLSGDGVHPTGSGQQAITYRIIADVPEVME